MILGKVAIGPGETGWRYTPDRPWTAGKVRLRIDRELEDLAGNSIVRPFEVDEIRPLGTGLKADFETIEVTIGQP